MNHKKYIIIVLSSIWFFIIIFAVYLIYLDPYWIWREEPPWLQKWQGHNRVLDIKHRFSKTAQSIIRKPNIIILGSSRVYRGIDTEKYHSKDMYNFGISSLTIREAKSYIQHFIRFTPVETIILGLDYFMFDNNGTYRPGFDPDTGNHKYPIKAISTSLISKTAFNDAKLALSGEHSGDGYWTRSGFKKTNPRNKKEIERVLVGFYKDEYVITDEEYEVLSKLLSMVTKNESVKLYVYISPLNSRHIERMKQAGMIEDFMQWKKRIKEILSEKNIELYDFSFENPFYNEEIIQSTEHWIDTSHFAPSIGDWILREIGI